MYDFEFWRQRREEFLREAEMNRLARTIRSNRKRKSQQSSPLEQNTERYNGGLVKFLRALKYEIQK